MKIKTHYHDEIESMRFPDDISPRLNDAYFDELVETNPSFCAVLIKRIVEGELSAIDAMQLIELLQPIDNERDFE